MAPAKTKILMARLDRAIQCFSYQKVSLDAPIKSGHDELNGEVFDA